MKRRICIIVLTLAIVFTSIVPIFAIQEDDPRETPHRTIVAASDYHGYAGVTTSSKKRDKCKNHDAFRFSRCLG